MTLTYQFDALNRVSVKIVPERTGLTTAQTRDVHYEYDNRGLQTKARFDSLAGEGVSDAYDGFGGRISTTLAMAGTSRILTFSNDLNGNRTTVAHPDGAYVGYRYDGLDRMTAFLENGWLELGTLVYDPAGRREGLAMLGVSTSYAYDNVSRLAALTHDLGGASLTAQDQHQSFAYNPASQMIGRTAANDAYAWSHPDSYVRSYAANGLNQYSGTTSTGAAPAAYSYDPNGNLASDGTRFYVYDVENRLVSASGGASAALVYDPLGRLFQTSGGTAGIAQFLYDGDELVFRVQLGGHGPSPLHPRPRLGRSAGLVRGPFRLGPPKPDRQPPGLDRRRGQRRGRLRARQQLRPLGHTGLRQQRPVRLHRPGVDPGAGAVVLQGQVLLADGRAVPAGGSDRA